MVHKILPDIPEKKTTKLKKALVKLRKNFKEGKWGLTLTLNKKEVFFGIIVNDIIIEQTRRKKVIKEKGRMVNFFPTPS